MANIGGLSNNGATLNNINGFLNKNLGVPLPKTQTPAYNPSQNMSVAPSSGMNSSNASMVGSTQGILNQSKPTTPVKSISTPDGTTMTYHTPDVSTKAPDDPSNKYNTTTGQLNSKYVDPNAPTTSTQTNANGSTTSPNYTPPNQGTTGINQGGLINNAIGQSTTPNPIAQTAGNTLNQFSQQESPEVTQARQNLLDAQKQFAKQSSDINQSGTWTSRALGEQGQANIQNSNTLNALSGTLNSALTSQGQQIGAASSAGGVGNAIQGLQQGALGTAIGANAPASQFGMLTSPTTGQIIGGNGATASGVMQSALQNAVNMINSGKTSYQDAYNTSGLSAFGVLGQTALQNALNGSGNGTFSPTTNNTQVGVNQTQLGNYQTQAVNLDTSLKQIDTISPNILNLLKTSGLNPTDSSLTNTPINSYISQLGNSLAGKQLSLVMNDLQKFSSQILSADSSLTPTQKTESVLNQDPSTLSFKQMQGYLDTLKSLGGNQLSVIQGQVGNLGGTGTGYTGTPSTGSTSLPTATPNANMQGLTLGTSGQALGGVGLGIGTDIANIATQGGNVLSFILGKLF